MLHTFTFAVGEKSKNCGNGVGFYWMTEKEKSGRGGHDVCVTTKRYLALLSFAAHVVSRSRRAQHERAGGLLASPSR